MIKSLNQSITIYAKRLQSGKEGFPKAIERYLKREHADKFQYMKTKIQREAWQIAHPPVEEEAEEVA